MLIEQKTSYAYKLKYLENPTFDRVRGFAKNFIDDLPKELVDELYSQLDRGVVQIDSEPQMLVYLYSFGNMHQAKLNKAFENIPEILFDQPEINIIDYGCGQAIGTMCYVDFIRQKSVSQKVKRVTLIEPSEICLKRAALHVSKFCPDAEIVTVNKEFDELDDEDIVCEEDIPTLHILSNVLDLDFDLDRFAELISEQLKGYNQFVCVGPYFGVSNKDERMGEFCSFLNGEENYSESFDKFELNGGKAWTAQIRCFSVGELEEELSTEVTEEDIQNGVADEYGVVYSRDGKRLLNGNKELDFYVIKNGTRVICDEAFAYCLSLQQITIPNSVTNIGEWTFSSCLSLQQITIPNSVTNIGEGTFSSCDSLQQITIPNSVTNIGEWTFSSCDSLQQITIPHSVTSIGDFVFMNCKSLQQITIPNSLMSIGEWAFAECKSLQQITIPNSVTSIGFNPFVGCSLLTLKSQSSHFIVDSDLLIDRKKHSIIAYVGDNEELDIPNSVTSIGVFAFNECDSLQQITIPNSVTIIGEKAFYGCKSLQQIIIPKSVTSIGKLAFCGCSSLQQITIPNSVTSIGEEAFCGCESLQQITIPNSVTSIGEKAFSWCNSLQQIAIPKSVTSIEKSVFEYCRTLQQIAIPNSVTTIGKRTFWHCESLQQITIPNSVTSIGEEAFAYCVSLLQISISKSITSIGDLPFSWCDSLERIIISKDCVEHFKQMLPIYLWDKLYYLKKAV